MPGDAGTEARNVAGAMTGMRIDELISNLAIGIAEGQLELDKVCMQIAKFMGEAQIQFGKKPNSDEPDLLSLVELGFTPNFYQFVDTILDVRVSVSSSYEEERSYESSSTAYQSTDQSSSSSNSSNSSNYSQRHGVSWGWHWWHGGVSSTFSRGSNNSSSSSSSSYKKKTINMTTVDAKFASKYNYNVEASSSIKTKIVPVPPPDVFEEIIRSKLQQRRDDEQRDGWKLQVRNTVSGIQKKISVLDDGVKSKLESDVLTLTSAEVKTLDGFVATIADDYGTLSENNWTVVNSPADQASADGSLQAIIEATDKLYKRVVNADDTIQDEPSVLETAINTELSGFDTTLSSILEKVTPEEEDGGDSQTGDSQSSQADEPADEQP